MIKLILLYFVFVVSGSFSQLTLAKEINRIVALSPHSVEMLFAIGAGSKIVGTVEYADFPQDALKIPRIGNYNSIQIERIVALQPDLIVVWKSGNKQSDLDKLSSLGFKLYYSQAKNITEISEELTELGVLLKLNKNAEKATSKLKQKYFQIKKKYSNKSKVNVFYQLWDDPLRTVGKGSWIASLIEDCHAENIYNDVDVAYPMISLENVISKNPQIIIIPDHSGKKINTYQFWEKWTMIDAVENKKIYTVDGDLLHRHSPRAVDGLNELCNAIDKARQ